MQTIVLATQKGGSGKSTLAIGLALAATRAGHTVRLIEADSQGTLSNWQRRRNSAESIVEPVHDAGDIEPMLQAFEHNGVTLAIIDTAGGMNAATTSAIRHADFCLLPSRPSVADIEATAPTLSVVRAWQKPFAFVLNQTPIRGQRVTNAASALADEAALDAEGVLARPFIVMRNDHQDALGAGLAVNEYAPASKSADEINGLWQWIETRMNAAMIADGGVIVSNLPETSDAVATMPVPVEAEAAAFAL